MQELVFKVYRLSELTGKSRTTALREVSSRINNFNYENLEIVFEDLVYAMEKGRAYSFKQFKELITSVAFSSPWHSVFLKYLKPWKRQISYNDILIKLCEAWGRAEVYLNLYEYDQDGRQKIEDLCEQRGYRFFSDGYPTPEFSQSLEA